MIRINLLAVDGRSAKKKKTKAAIFHSGQPLAALCCLILIGAALFVGWRYWDLGRVSVKLDEDIAAAQQESARLRSIIAEVQQFELRKGQLQQRVSLIEQLRKDQTGPVHMLDQISKAMPPMLWLTDMQQGEKPNEVVIGGRCASMTSLSDFVVNLEASGYFQKSVEIISSQIETQASAGELIKFSIRGVFQQPGGAAASPRG